MLPMASPPNTPIQVAGLARHRALRRVDADQHGGLVVKALAVSD